MRFDSVELLPCQAELDPAPVIDDVDTSILSFIEVFGRPPEDYDDDNLDEDTAFKDFDDGSDFGVDDDDVEPEPAPESAPQQPVTEPAPDPASSVDGE